MKILVPTSVTLDESRLGLEGEDTVVSYDPTVNIDAEHYDADVLISWANTNEQLKDAAAHLEQVELVQSLLAGRAGRGQWLGHVHRQGGRRDARGRDHH